MMHCQRKNIIMHAGMLGSHRRTQLPRVCGGRLPARRLASQIACQQVKYNVDKGKIDVAVVGGGPGGLAAANSILRVSPQLKVRVFEKAKRLLPVGFTLGLPSNAWSALVAINPSCADKVDSMCLTDGPFVKMNAEGEDELRLQSLLALSSKFIVWHKLQESLFSFLPEGTVQLDSTLEDLTVGPDSGVILNFVNQPKVHASIVIGCDGNQSTVRKLSLGDFSPPIFLNRAIWRGQTATPVDWPYKDNTATWFTLKSGATFNTAKVDEGSLAWSVGAAWQSEDLPRLASNRYTDGAATMSDDSGKRNRCLEVIGDDASQLSKDIIGSTPASTITEHGLFCREPKACTSWGKGPITLLGDAAHLSTPVLGQGTSMALEDAVELGRAIGKLGATEAALREYESVRLPRASKVQAASVEIAKAFYFGTPSAMSEMEWFMQNPWCQGYKSDPLLPAEYALRV